MSTVRVALLLAGLLLAGCGDSDNDSATVPGVSSQSLLQGAGPDGSFYAPPPSGEGRSLATYWPIVLSHPWSRTADNSFQGDIPEGDEFEPYGVKKMLEAAGAVVYQPDKLPYASHERRGQLLYKKCAGTTVDEVLCEGENPEPVDGIHLATIDYCADADHRARHGFSDVQQCQRELQFNIICHSQGCPDSRYMLAAVTNEFSGKLMYQHVASWTSLAGANKGTAQADWVLEMLAACLFPECRSLVLDLALGVDGFSQNGALTTQASESVVALSRKYMLETTDMDCTPGRGVECAPSFNELYPLPEDPQHPILYQSFTSQINDISHPCFTETRLFWEIVQQREGANDGNISVDSQQFTTYGAGSTGGATPVMPRWIMGETLDPEVQHPGLPHMAYASAQVPGMDEGRMSCMGEDNSGFRFSREGFYRDLVAELVSWGY